MDKIYQDFVERFLPSIQQGLTITKEYFFDLFGRYVTYLIISDGFWMTIGIVSVVASAILFVKLHRYLKDDYAVSGLEFLTLIPFIFGLVVFFVHLENLVKDIFIPEIRIYEELKNFKK